MSSRSDYMYIHVMTCNSYNDTISNVLNLTSKGYNASFYRIHDLEIYEVHVLKPTNSAIQLSDLLAELKENGYADARLV